MGKFALAFDRFALPKIGDDVITVDGCRYGHDALKPDFPAAAACIRPAPASMAKAMVNIARTRREMAALF